MLFHDNPHHIGLATPDLYAKQLEHKRDRLTHLFADYTMPECQVYPSPCEGFRMRAEFRIWHEGDDLYFVMFDKSRDHAKVVINEFSIGSATIQRLMPQLLTVLRDTPQLRKKLFQVEFLTTTLNQALISLIYHRPLDTLWEVEAKRLETLLGVHIIGRSRKQKIVCSQDYVWETFEVADRPFRYQQRENGFTQPNAFVARDMLRWSCDSALELGGDLLELYCGNGNFTLPLSTKFDRVLATEVSSTSVASAIVNILENGVSTIEVARMSSEEISAALKGEREFRRLAHLQLADYRFSTVFVDPPRAGLDKQTLDLIRGFDNILYVSCNPTTLKDNLEHLNKTHDVDRWALFDQFPYTDHIESGLLLTRRS